MRLFFLTLCLLVSGCASVEKNIAATQESGKQSRLKVSAELNNDLSSEYFGMIEFSFENQTNKWIEINDVIVDVNDEMLRKSSKFTSGNELAAWSKAISARNRIESYNKAIAYSAIIGLASATAVSSSSNNTRGAATGVAVAGLTSLTVEQFIKYKNEAEGGAIYPSGHILNSNLLVPPELFSQYWLLINTTDHETNKLLNKISMTINYKDGESEKFSFNLFSSYLNTHRYRWQKKIHARLKKTLYGKSQYQ